MVELPAVHPRTVRPTGRSPRAHSPDAKSRGTRDNAARLLHMEPVRVHHTFLARCIDRRKSNRTNHPISYLNTLLKTRRESIEAIMRELISSWRFLVCQCDIAFSVVTFVLFCFVFVFLLSFNPRPFVQSLFDTQAPRPAATRSRLTTVCALFSFVDFSLLWRWR